MNQRQPLSQGQVLELLEELPGWSLSEESGKPVCLSAEYVFKDFKQAFTFMTAVAFLSEQMNHHPEWENSFKKVKIHISTHDVGGVTALDLEWARSTHEIYEKLSS